MSSVNRLRIAEQQSTRQLDGEKHHDDGGRGDSKGDKRLPVMPRPVGAGLAPHLDHFGLVFIRRRIGAGQREPRTCSVGFKRVGLKMIGVGSVLETRLRT